MNIAGRQASVKASSESLSLPDGRGTYALFFHLDQPLSLSVGRLGMAVLPAGVLIYVGSALGSGGVRARLHRHLQPHKSPHWHIDALTNRCQPRGWQVDLSGRRQECAWVRELLALPGASVPIPGFGSSDCRAGCPAHLLALPPDFPTEFPDFVPAIHFAEASS